MNIFTYQQKLNDKNLNQSVLGSELKTADPHKERVLSQQFCLVVEDR